MRHEAAISSTEDEQQLHNEARSGLLGIRLPAEQATPRLAGCSQLRTLQHAWDRQAARATGAHLCVAAAAASCAGSGEEKEYLDRLESLEDEEEEEDEEDDDDEDPELLLEEEEEDPSDEEEDVEEAVAMSAAPLKLELRHIYDQAC